MKVFVVKVGEKMCNARNSTFVFNKVDFWLESLVVQIKKANGYMQYPSL